MITNMASRYPISFGRGFFLILGAAILSGCATRASLRLYPDDVPAGSLRLVQAVASGTRDELKNNAKEWYDALLASGVNDKDISDGSVAVGRIWCCGGPAEVSDRQAFYVPRGLEVKLMDIVEIRAGYDPKNHPFSRVNTATRVVQHAESKDDGCRWEPTNPRLWMRVLHCDWMEREGWIELNEGLQHTWYKPSPKND
jgi:hypothetical protein